MVSQPRSGTSASAHEPNSASPEANSPPKSASATSDRPTVRRIGQSFDTLLVAVIVRPSSGSPRRPDSGQAMTLSGTDSRVRAAVVPAAATTTPTSTASATTPPASRNIVVVVSTAASTAQAIVQGLRRWRATTHMSRPAASRVRVTARPTLRSGQVSAAQAPMPSAAQHGERLHRHALLGPDAVERSPAATGCAGARRRRGRVDGRRRAASATRGGRGRRWRARGGRRCRHGALLTQVGGPAGAGAPGQDGAQVRAGGSGGGRQGGDDAAVQLADPARDGQAEPGAAGVVAAGAEPVEDPLHAVGRDAGAVVADLEPPGVVADAAGDHPHLSPGRAVPHRVVDEVGDELGEPGRVGDHGEVGRVRLVHHGHRRGRRPGPPRPRRAAGHRPAPR